MEDEQEPVGCLFPTKSLGLLSRIGLAAEKEVPVFNKIIDRLRYFFGIDILNYYPSLLYLQFIYGRGRGETTS